MPYNALPEVRRGPDLVFARIEDAIATLKRDAPLNEAEQMHVRFIIRDLAAVADVGEVDFHREAE